jgi:3'-5' exoribonuclease
MAHKFINEIGSGEQVDDIFMVKDPILRSTSNGGLYIAMYICDKTGQLNGRMWQATEEAYNTLPKPGFIHVNGRSELYQGNMQLIINHFSVIDPSQVETSDFLPRTDKDRRKLFADVKKVAGQINNEQIKAIVDDFLADKELMRKFCEAPAAMKMHHNYLGGLLEHTQSMLQVASAILPLYPNVNKDLVLAGILIHDMGKTEELSYDMAFSYTDAGQLIGHITKTVVMLNQKADSLRAAGTEISEDVINALSHIILAHHGEYAFGSPKLPATPEAFMVNYIDNLDAKMNQLKNLIENEPGDDNWTAWQNSLQTRVYRKRLEE